MKWGERIKGTALFTGISFIIICVAVFLADLLLLRVVEIKVTQVILMGFLSALLLSPLFLWIRVMLEHGGIEATQLSDLELNERDVREAVSNWVFIHYNKKLEGNMEFSRDESGNLNCKVTVRSDS